MRLLLGAAVAALLIASPAMAQTDPAAPATCGAVTPAPTDMPDGATASRAEVEAFTERFNAWATATNEVLACKRTRAEQARAQADAFTSEFNTENAALRQRIDSWEVEVNEFNARNVPARRDRRSRERN